ncbi:MAG: flagellar hook-associated protein FlgK [Phycisphaerales bacterium]|nr:flagellar hook-associated protein FlgK [Phycisphaerales bacterium]MCB9835627.1 flagellar hook-associated protein FlgK [Phycisphaera sp.]
MGIGAAFTIGRSALAASQLGVQVASNNLANAATEGYTRQTLGLQPIAGDANTQEGQIGNGVRFTGVRRQLDPAIEKRFNASISESAAATEILRAFSGIETILNELTDLDLSSELGDFFTGWSELANGTQAQSQVVEQGQLLAGFIQRLRSDLTSQRNELDDRLGALTSEANNALTEIARLNEQITSSESGGATNNPLRDQRDQLVRELSEIMDVTVIEQASGAIDVLVGSSPVVLGSKNQGLELRNVPKGDRIETQVAIASTGQVLDVRKGKIGGVFDSRDGTVDETIGKLDELAGQLIYQINALHATGATARGLTSASSELQFATADQSLALSNPGNTTIAELPVKPTNGGFIVRTVDEATGAVTTTRIDIDLDGLTNAGQPGFTDDTTLQDIASAIDAITGLSASIAGDGRLSINATQGTTFTFADDTSGVLAALGVNSYFQGTDATDIAVSDHLANNPLMLMTGRYIEGTFHENGTSLAIADLQDNGLEAFGGQSVGAFWRTTVQKLSVQTGSARVIAESTSLVRDGLESQRLAMSGVDTDEEALNLMQFQRAYQGAARIIQTTNEMLDTLINLI